MKINFLDLKELNPMPSANNGGNDILTEYLIGRMFDIHMESSRTIWDRKMFDEELKRDGSGFLICYSDSYAANGGDNRPDLKKFTEKNIEPDLKIGLQSLIIGFFIYYNVLDEMHILDITVSKEMQSKGIGSLMLNTVVKKNSEAGIKHFFLEVGTSNIAAINLYKKFGFKIFLLRKNYYDDNGEDALCMVKES
ncbi:MAG: ribosomal protein S18-alanine N-acetyltransferase [Candidatus Acidulodesulfobacterium sp.]